jgi:hypothetical protein
MVDERGPFLATAVACEKVLQEQDGVLSIIRVIDRVFHSKSGPDVPSEMEPFAYNFVLLITLKAGEARGRYTVTIRPEAPSGEQQQANSIPVLLEGEERGANLIVNMAFSFTMEGLWWFDVLFEDRLLTRVPLRIVYQPTRVAGGPPEA